ncbi:7-cyano-7-deazaguanine tRNA-ribosyltransferase [Elysia marginata]|uniref:7-cyano-7-deazaguanine tRNA-ribosyltransferase n=1 Tax=Elysia marginata TaxID=1093978 RepID=A0AAV4H2L6_9GAST|nr:7-cyano-7-deazaguanine tRNA-ribosyltransferase [Elysia marginata]
MLRKINDEERFSINDEYWSLIDYSRKKDFLLANYEVNNVERVRVDSDKRKRTRQSSKTYLFTRRGYKHRVCQKFFLSTLILNISSGPIDKAINGKSDGSAFNEKDQRGRHKAWNKTPEEKIQAVKDHINMFPRIESHYTRKSSKRMYPDPNLSIAKMYQLFTEYCQENNLEPASERTYRKIFCEEFNLSFFKPKKDICATCHRYNQLTPAEQEKQREGHDKHIQRYRDSMKAKQMDKDRSNQEEDFISASFDLQSVLNFLQEMCA